MSFFNGKDEPENGFTIEDLKADAEKKLAILDALLADFETGDEQLTKGEICTASRTPLEYLEKSVAICDAAPELDVPPLTPEKLRLMHAAITIYAPVCQKAERLARLSREATWRTKLAGLSLARLVHRVAGLVAETGGPQWLREHVEKIKKIPGRPWRRKPKSGDS
jgi:hypothetical protein